MVLGRESRGELRAARRLGQHGALMAALAAAGLFLAACATSGTTAAGPEASREAAPQAAQTAQGEREAPPSARPAAERPAPARPGAGLLSPLATISYIPLKMIPCSLGVAGSALGFLFTLDTRMVQGTFTLNCGGDWIITPGMLEGREPFRPVGRVEDLQGPPSLPPPPPTAVAPPLREPGAE